MERHFQLGREVFVALVAVSCFVVIRNEPRHPSLLPQVLCVDWALGEAVCEGRSEEELPLCQG